MGGGGDEGSPKGNIMLDFHYKKWICIFIWINN